MTIRYFQNEHTESTNTVPGLYLYQTYVLGVGVFSTDKLFFLVEIIQGSLEM